jgi:prepilin-type N-terminal cleavage/methylation domain-containing protein
MNKLTNKLNSQKGQSGFTIIEVLIVLAIAALIILAVLLAVPALQTNQKNSQRRAEAARIAGAVASQLADKNNSYAGLVQGDIEKAANISSSTQITSVTLSDPADPPATATAYISKGTCANGKFTAVSTSTSVQVIYYKTTGTDGVCLTAL